MQRDHSAAAPNAVTPSSPTWCEPWWRPVLRAIAFSALMALVFTLIGFIAFAQGDGAWRNVHAWAHYYVGYLQISLCIGACIHIFLRGGQRVLGRRRVAAFVAWQRVAFFGGLPLLGVVVGMQLSKLVMGDDLHFVPADSNKGVGILLFTLLLTAVIYQFYSVRFRQLAAERRATEAQLRLLQGQMEPHFLFNTLANVLSLLDADTPRAKVMLEAFVDYLRSSLTSLRRSDNTLGDELQLVEAYLRIIAIRMDQRLRYRIDVDDRLRALPLPPLTLQPLVENAVVHGLEPRIEGGTVTVSAAVVDGMLQLAVEDDGMGLPDAAPLRRPAGTGTALANIRERLRSAHGAAARLDIGAAAHRGVRATLRIPVPTMVAAA